MRIFAPQLMADSKIIDRIVARGSTLTTALGGYVVRDYECALLRVQGSENRNQIPVGERIRFLNPTKTYELIRINQQQQEMQFSVEADTRALPLEIKDIPVFEKIRCNLTLRFRVRDPRRLVVDHSIAGDQELLEWIERTLSNAFLKLSRHGSAKDDPLEGSLWEFLLLPVADERTSQLFDKDGRVTQTAMRLRSEELLMSMLSVQLGEIGLAPGVVNITSVDIPAEAQQLMHSLLAARGERLVHAEHAMLHREQAIAALAKKEVDAQSTLLDAFAAKTADIDMYVGTLKKYGLDAKTAMVLKSLVGTGSGGESEHTSDGSSVDTLVRLVSFSLLSNLLGNDAGRLKEVVKDLGVPEGVEARFISDTGDETLSKAARELKRFVKDLYLVRDGIDGGTHDTLQALLGDLKAPPKESRKPQSDETAPRED